MTANVQVREHPPLTAHARAEDHHPASPSSSSLPCVELRCALEAGRALHEGWRRTSATHVQTSVQGQGVRGPGEPYLWSITEAAVVPEWLHFIISRLLTPARGFIWSCCELSRKRHTTIFFLVSVTYFSRQYYFFFNFWSSGIVSWSVGTWCGVCSTTTFNFTQFVRKVV